MAKNPVDFLLDRRLVAVVELANHRSAERAGDLVGLGKARVMQQLRELRDVYKDDILTDTFEPTMLGERLLDEWRDMLDRARASVLLGDRITVVAHLPQHTEFVTEAQNRVMEGDSEMAVELKNLGEEGRSIGGFEDKAVAPMKRHLFGLAVGLRPHDGTGFLIEPLYWARLEAMIPKDEALDHIEVRDLIRRDLCVAPIDTRSRKNLESAIRRVGADDPDENSRVIAETVGTKGLIIHALTTRIAKKPTVVVPSDVAHSFKEGQLMAGPKAVDWKWIPVLADGNEIQHQVFVSTKKTRSTATAGMVAALHQVVDEMQIGVERQGA